MSVEYVTPNKCKHKKAVRIAEDTDAMVCLGCKQIVIMEYMTGRGFRKEIIVKVNPTYAEHVREKYGEELLERVIVEGTPVPEPVEINYLKHKCGIDLKFIAADTYQRYLYYCPECDILIYIKNDGTSTPITPDDSNFTMKDCERIREAHNAEIEPLKEYTSQW